MTKVPIVRASTPSRMMRSSWVCLLSFLPLACSSEPAPTPTPTPGKTGEVAPPRASSADSFEIARQRMVEQQIKGRGIKAPAVVQAMLEVPRHRFLTPEIGHLAYEDHALRIGSNQSISQPYMVAYMTEAADISPGEKVLEIGTGSGYQAAVLGELAREVYTIEIIPVLAEGARSVLAELGYTNVHVRTGNGYLGWPEQAPFDAIVVTAAPEEVPQALVDQLAVGGKMIIPVGAANTYQDMMIIERTRQGVVKRRTIPVRFVPMTGKPES